MLPVGLLGDAKNTALVWGVMASLMASTSISKFSSRGTGMASPPHTSAEKAYIPKVGVGIMMFSPGPMKIRSSRSISSSLPFPTTILSDSTSRYPERASRIRR